MPQSHCTDQGNSERQRRAGLGFESLFLSQSHCTDQGNSEGHPVGPPRGVADLPRRNPTVLTRAIPRTVVEQGGKRAKEEMSQSHRTDLGNSEGPHFISFGRRTYNPFRRYPRFRGLDFLPTYCQFTAPPATHLFDS